MELVFSFSLLLLVLLILSISLSVCLSIFPPSTLLPQRKVLKQLVDLFINRSTKTKSTTVFVNQLIV